MNFPQRQRLLDYCMVPRKRFSLFVTILNSVYAITNDLRDLYRMRAWYRCHNRPTGMQCVDRMLSLIISQTSGINDDG